MAGSNGRERPLRFRGPMSTAGLAAAVAGILLALAPGVGARPETAPPGESGRRPVVVVVDARSNIGPVRPGLLGVNHHYTSNGFGLWDPVADEPVPAVVAGVRHAGVQLVRYPGGTVANMFDWNSAIGDGRGCQVDAKLLDEGGYRAVPGGQAYGPDEHMEFVDAVGARAVLMVQSITQRPRAAANWVEYMNSAPGTPLNPNGGVDWADVRADNGHPAPYDVNRWEVGNEQRFADQRYWMSSDRDVAVRQYAFGGARNVVAEPLGRDCWHPVGGVRSSAEPGQVFDVLFPPLVPDSVRATIAGEPWIRVPDLAAHGPDDEVFTVDPLEGTLQFGDGVHGAIPPQGAVVRASYRSVHEGFFAFARAMKQVDPTIDVCASWGVSAFVTEVGNRRYDCFTAHAYTHFLNEGHSPWASPLEGHDWHMLGTDTERDFVAELRRTVPAGVPMPLTEFGQLWGDIDAFPHYPVSMTGSVYMASQWVSWLRLGIPFATGNDLLAKGERGLLWNPPDYTVSAEAITRRALLPMFLARGRQLRVLVEANPVRDPGLGAGTYRGLRVAATRGADGRLHVLVVNRLPLAGQSVPVTVRLDDAATSGAANVRRVDGASFQSWNPPDGQPQVVLETWTRDVGTRSFDLRVPPHSVTVLAVRLR